MGLVSDPRIKTELNNLWLWCWCRGRCGGWLEGGVLQVAVHRITVADVRPVGRVQCQGWPPSPTTGDVDCLDVPGRTVPAGVLQGGIAVIRVADVRPVGRVQRQGRVRPAIVRNPGHYLDIPGRTIPVGVLQVVVGPILVGDVRPAGRV